MCHEGVIDRITFGRWGMIYGKCPNYFSTQVCNIDGMGTLTAACKGLKECKFKVSKDFFSKGDNMEPAVKDEKVALCEDEKIDKKMFKMVAVVSCLC